MKRRDFMQLVGGLAASWPLAASAQQKTMPVIGMLVTTAKHAARFLDNIRQGLADHGYIEGNDYRFEFRRPTFRLASPRLLFGESLSIKKSR